MLTIPKAVQEIVRGTPFLEVGLSRGILNLSAVARMMLPEVRKTTYKSVTEASVVMALRRLASEIGPLFGARKGRWKSYEVIVRSNLMELTVLNAHLTTERYDKLLRLLKLQKKYFFTVTQGIFETTVIVSQELRQSLQKILTHIPLVNRIQNLSSITLRLSAETVSTPGVYYLILLQLAWAGINVIEVVSTYSEFTIILSSQEVDRAFTVLKTALPEQRIGL